MIFSCSMIEPGHPWVTISGSAPWCWERNVDEVDVQPVDLGDEVRQVVQFRLAFAPVVAVAQYRASSCITASRTPCESSVTVSRSGHLVAFTRLRNRRPPRPENRPGRGGP